MPASTRTAGACMRKRLPTTRAQHIAGDEYGQRSFLSWDRRRKTAQSVKRGHAPVNALTATA